MIGMAKRSARPAVVALLVAAVAGTAAGQASAAGVRPDDRSGIHGAGTVVRGVPRPSHPSHALRPDDRPGIRGVVSQSRVLRVVAPFTRTSSSFHWDDALIGAAVAAGAALLLVLGVLGVRRHVRLAPHAPMPTSVERSL
jgi:hypothetical protein